MSRSVRTVLLACGILAYGALARHIHNSIVQSKWPAGYASLNPVYLLAFGVLSVLFLVYAWRTVWSAEHSSSDWGLALLGRAWISIPILIVILTLSLLGAETGPAKPVPQVIAIVLILFPSSIIIRSFLMRVISSVLGQKSDIAFLGIAASGMLFMLVHPDKSASLISDFASNVLSSSFVAITGSIFASLVFDAVRLLNPPVSQAAILLPAIGLILYLVITLVTSLFAKRGHGTST